MQLHYETCGTGAPLIILHGLLGSLENWHTVSRRLGGYFRVFAVDQRNHGRSLHTGKMSFELMAEDVRELMESQRLDHAHVLGHSMGGKIAMQLALTHPALVDRLVVVDIAPSAYSPRHVQILHSALSLDLSQFQNRGDADRALAPSIPDKAVRQFLLKNLARDEAGGLRWKLNLKDIAVNYERMSQALSSDTPFNGPTLFVRGGQSSYIRDADMPLIRQLFPHAEMATIPHADHWVHAEAPEPFLKVVLDFLSDSKPVR
jgi:esterase